jgi:hypothetical protein
LDYGIGLISRFFLAEANNIDLNAVIVIALEQVHTNAKLVVSMSLQQHMDVALIVAKHGKLFKLLLLSFKNNKHKITSIKSIK